ncbi:hypothetical protein KC717_01120 [Candidatus Dojkabacteria bacterium]|uniref:Uncharacterized protein n=1 Tax=Candidatus Dojkabacteria bacterium TaxID=2099670 RepID=A0A955RKA0_9BACT|nr:hypothetical protein [Candidatus Dojkabacteria bacterium]
MKNKSLLLIIVAVVIVGIFAGGGYLLYSKTDRTGVENPVPEGGYTAIEVRTLGVSEESQELVGTLYREEDGLVFREVQDSNVGEYIVSSIDRWETETLEYEYGNMNESGAIEEGVVYTDISKPDVLNAVYAELYDMWDGYDFELR